MNNGLRVEGNEVVLCGDRICCARITKIGENQYRVTDDNGNSVILTKQEVELMSKGRAQCEEVQLTGEQLILG